MVHHEGRNGKARGTSKREDTLDTIIRLEPLKPKEEDDDEGSDDCTMFELSYPKSREFYGADAAPMTLRLSTSSGKAEWSAEPQREDKRERAAELHKQGLTQKEIAEELGVSQPRVSQMVKEVGRKKY
jgi:putative DNA primase/helicase